MDNFVSRAYDYVVSNIALNATQIQACNRCVTPVDTSFLSVAKVHQAQRNPICHQYSTAWRALTPSVDLVARSASRLAGSAVL